MYVLDGRIVDRDIFEVESHNDDIKDIDDDDQIEYDSKGFF